MALLIEMQRKCQYQLETLFNTPWASSLLLIFSLLLVWFTRFLTKKSLNLPPSPPKLPIIGHLHCLGTLPHRSLQALAQKYGPLMLLHLGYTPAVVVSSSKVGREILKTHEVAFSNRPITAAARAFLYGGLDVGFAPYGEYWRQIRKICVADLLSVKRVQSFRFVRDEEVTGMVNKIKEASSMKMGVVNLSDMIIYVTNNVTSRVALGRSLGSDEGYGVLAKEVNDLFGVFSVEDMFPSFGWVDVLTGLRKRMKIASKAIHKFFDELIEEHLTSRKHGAHADGKDIIDLLLEFEKNPTLGFEFARENVRSIILDIFVAGTDTVYTTIEWAMAELMNHPNMMKRLQEEVRGVVGRESKVNENDIHKMNYLNCVIKETLRLHPPTVLSIPRISTADTNIEGYHVPAKTRVIVNLWAIQRDPEMWENPTEFIPERFLNSSIDFRGKDFEFIPFGAGRRGCPGISFSMAIVESVLANLLYWFDWELHRDGANKMNVDMTETFGLSVRLKLPLNLVPKSHF